MLLSVASGTPIVKMMAIAEGRANATPQGHAAKKIGSSPSLKDGIGIALIEGTGVLIERATGFIIRLGRIEKTR